MKGKALDFAIKKYRDIKKAKAYEKAGYKSVSQREAYMLENFLTVKDKQHYCERKAYAQIKYFPNLDEPHSYNEKLLWLALHYKNPLISKCTDKYEMKRYINDIYGDKYTVGVIGVYENVNHINFDDLPNQFVIKSTAGWGGKQVIIVKDKKTADIDKIKSFASEWLYPWNTYYYNNMCITDEKIVPRILVEEYIEDSNGLNDYKIYCFNGVPKLLLVVKGRNTKHQQRTFVDIEKWDVLPFARNKMDTAENIERPNELEDLISISRNLSQGIPVLRVDFFLANGRIYIGELTFSPGLFLRINPKEWDFKLGELIDLDGINEEDID